MKTSDYLPHQLQQFLNWILNLIEYIRAGGLARFDIPDAEFNDLSAKADDFAAKFKVAETLETRTKATIQAMHDAHTLSEKATRNFVKRFLAPNPKVTNADRDNMGLPIYSDERHPAPIAPTFPWVRVLTTLIRHLIFDFGGSEASKAKLAGQHGMELTGIVADEKPVDISQLTMSYFSTSTPLTVEFAEAQRGKTFWFAVRWENTRGQKGPWSEIMSAVIP
jgi:hypothetical protein